MTLPRVARDSSVFFVRCEVIDDDGAVVAENVYWQSQQRDDVGDPTNDFAFELKQVSWADMTALNWMPRVPLEVSAQRTDAAGENGVTSGCGTPPSKSRSSSAPRSSTRPTATRSCRSSTATTT